MISSRRSTPSSQRWWKRPAQAVDGMRRRYRHHRPRSASPLYLRRRACGLDLRDSSVTKTFTGLALAQLAAQGKVRLDQPVRPLLFPDNLPAAPISEEITLLDLITHRSGLPSVPGNLVLTDPGNPFGDYNPVALREFFGSRATQRPADAKYSYSSFGIALLGFALAQREGITYSQLISTEITGPLRMKDTMFALSPEQSRRVVQGHSADLDPVEAELEIAESSPARSAQNRRSETCSSISMRTSIPITTFCGRRSNFAGGDAARRDRSRSSASGKRDGGYPGRIQLAV